MELSYFSLLPSDGDRCIQTFFTVSPPGSSLVKVAVKKDGHHFYTHINRVVVDPEEPLRQSQATDDIKDDFKGKDAKMLIMIKTLSRRGGLVLSF